MEDLLWQIAAAAATTLFFNFVKERRLEHRFTMEDATLICVQLIIVTRNCSQLASQGRSIFSG
jgi:hypothetical protein